MTSDPSRWDGLGVPAGTLEPGMAVMVPVGMVNAVVNGGPAVICYATVTGPADEPDMWWLDVHMAPGATLPQMYRVDQILGVPAVGLSMPTVPAS